MSSLKLSFAVSLLFLLPLWTAAQTGEVTQIRITSSWGGLGTPAHDQLVITRKANDYYAHGKKLNAALVSNLLSALDAPAIPEIDLANLGITQEWLDANAEAGVKEYADFFYSTAAPNLQALYLSTFTDMTFMKAMVPSTFQGWWTDDYPNVEVELTRAGFNKLVATSRAQQLFMLPWEVSNGEQKRKTGQGSRSGAKGRQSFSGRMEAQSRLLARPARQKSRALALSPLRTTHQVAVVSIFRVGL
jgi:hypothetical protein